MIIAFRQLLNSPDLRPEMIESDPTEHRLKRRPIFVLVSIDIGK